MYYVKLANLVLRRSCQGPDEMSAHSRAIVIAPIFLRCNESQLGCVASLQPEPPTQFPDVAIATQTTTTPQRTIWRSKVIVVVVVVVVVVFFFYREIATNIAEREKEREREGGDNSSVFFLLSPSFGESAHVCVPPLLLPQPA